MIRRPTRTTRTDTLVPYTALFRSGQRTVGADHAVAGEHDRDWIASVRRAHRSHRLRLADAARDVAVAPGLPVGNLRQRPPDLALERRADRLQRQVGRLQRPGDIGHQLRTRSPHNRVISEKRPLGTGVVVTGGNWWCPDV